MKNKLTIKRPKAKEKFYSEAVFKIYANGSLVEKISQDESKEVTLDDRMVIIRAKAKGGYGSEKKQIDVSQIHALNIIANTRIGLHPLVFLLLLHR